MVFKYNNLFLFNSTVGRKISIVTFMHACIINYYSQQLLSYIRTTFIKDTY